MVLEKSLETSRTTEFMDQTWWIESGPLGNPNMVGGVEWDPRGDRK